MMFLSDIVFAFVLPFLASCLYLYWAEFCRTLHKQLNVDQSNPTILPKQFCPPPGPSLPPPKVSLLDDLQIDYFPDGSSIQAEVQHEPWYSDSTLTVQASISGTTVFEHASYRTRNGVPLPSGAASALLDKQTRIGSVTKAFTVLAILLSKDLIKWEDSITKFEPRLHKAAYENVTIGALASQTSGLGRFGYVGDLSFVPSFKPEQLGLSSLEQTLPGCDSFPGARICDTDEQLAMFNNMEYQPASPGSGPLYSNIAYNLLGIALEAAHQKSYQEIIKDLIFKPHGMKLSGFATPNDTENAILPSKGDSWFIAPFGNYDPSGGIWSTPNDLFTWTKALLHNELLPPAETRAWLQPRSTLPSLNQLVGAPWEIFRPTDLDVTVSRPIDIITKAGGIPGYAAYSAIVPECDIAISMTAAGNNAEAAIRDLFPAVLKPLVAYADQQAVKQAKDKYTGTYGFSHTNSTLIVKMDDGPGLVLAKFIMNDVNVLAALAQTQKIAVADPTTRLYPGDRGTFGLNGREKWRMLIDRDLVGNEGFAQMHCASWDWGDFARYVGAPLDTVVFYLEENGRVVSLGLLGWRAELPKVVEGGVL